MRGTQFKNKNLIGIVIIFFILLGVAIVSKQAKLFPIRTVTVDGNYWHISQTKIKNIVDRNTQNSFFYISLPRIQKDLLKELPWAESVSVSKQWPDKLNIIIEQKQVLAIWNGVALLQKNGELFYPLQTTFPKEFPLFKGGNDQKSKLVDLYQKMSEILVRDEISGELKITQIKMTSQGNCLITFNHKTVVMLGDMNILAKFRRFVAIYRQVFAAKQKIPEYVDMRYSHGLAVKWPK